MSLTFTNALLLLAYAFFMAFGQIAFKYVALIIGQPISLADAALKLPYTPWFWATGAIYGVSMIYWIWLLSRIPVTTAYPIASLSLVILPLLSWMIYGEAVTARYWCGVALVMGGLVLIVGQTS